MALACYQPVNHSSTNHRAKEELSERMPSDFLWQSLRYGDHIENNHLTAMSSALYQVPWRTQSDMDSAYSLEGEINICNGRQEGLKEGPSRVWHTARTWEMFKNTQTGGTSKGTALQGGTRKHNSGTLQIGEERL